MPAREQALTRDQVVDISIATAANAASLLEDAELLLAAGRNARAHALAVFALEEFGKQAMTVAALLRVSEEGFWRRYWRRFTSHTQKLQNARLGIQMFGKQDEIDEPDFADRIQRWATSAHVRRMQGIYVDLSTAGTVVEPRLAISHEEAAQLIEDVKLVVGLARFTAENIRGADLEGWPGWNELVASPPWDMLTFRRVAREVAESLRKNEP